MTRLTWNAVGERTFEAGVDRGVLFVSNVGVAWHGLISVAEKTVGGELTPYYIDGQKYLNHASLQEFEATITAYTYPEEFDKCQGVGGVKNGLFATNQKKQPFGLCYRTLVGNDVEGVDHAYKIHIVYNAMAEPSEKMNDTLSERVDPFDFAWEVLTKPPSFTGHQPTAHFVIDSRETPPELLDEIEDILYGTESSEPRLPSAVELLFLFESHEASVFDAGYLTEEYFTTFDAGELGDIYTSTIDGGSP